MTAIKEKVVIGDITLLRGDCLEIMPELIEEGLQADLILTDPPYLYLDHKLDKAFNEEQFFKLAYDLCKDFICFFGRGESFYKWNLLCKECGFNFIEELIWDKGRISNPMGKLMRIHETIALHRKSTRILNKVYINKIEYDLASGEVQKLENDLKMLVSKISSIKTFNEFEDWKKGEFNQIRKSKHNIAVVKFNGLDRAFAVYNPHIRGKLLSSILRINRENYTAVHPTQKPVEILQHLINLTTNESDLVIDCFLGGGSTAVACYNTGRKCIGIEIDKEYFHIAVKRVEEVSRQGKLEL